MKKIITIALIITFQSCLGQYPKGKSGTFQWHYFRKVDTTMEVNYSDSGKVIYIGGDMHKDTKPVILYGEAGIYQPVDSAKIYYHKFLEFTRKMNNPKISRKKFDQYEDSCKRYFELLNRVAGRNLKENQ